MSLNRESLIAGAIAGIIRSLLGWLESDTDFNWRMFTSTIVRTTILGSMWGFSSNLDPVSSFFYVFASDKMLSTGFKMDFKELAKGEGKDE